MRDESGGAVKCKSKDFHLCDIFNSTNVRRAIQENMGLVRGWKHIISDLFGAKIALLRFAHFNRFRES